MVDYVRFKNSTPLTRKPKKIDGTRYKEYLYGSVESLNTEWADKIVDYNPDLKLDTNGLSKFLDRNMSVSTDCGFDFNSSINSNVDVDVSTSDFTNVSNSGSDFSRRNDTQVEDEKKEVFNNVYQNESFQSSAVNYSSDRSPYNKMGDKSPLTSLQYQKFEELQTKYQDLSTEFVKVKNERNSYMEDAELLRSCRDRMNVTSHEFEVEVDPKEKLELLLDHIYTVLSDTFGSDNTLVSYLEKFANIYVAYQNSLEVELSSLRSKAEIVDNLDKLVSEKTNYDKALEQKDKTIDSLVEELKSSNADHTNELNRLREELDTVTSHFQSKVQELEETNEKYMAENQSLTEAVSNWETKYKRLLSDQHQILSQLPLVTLNVTTASKDDSKFSQNWPKSDFVSVGVVNSGSRLTSPLSKVDSTVGKTLRLTDKSPKLVVEKSDSAMAKSTSFDNTKFLQSVVQSLYTKNEEAIEAINKRDLVIKKQHETICKLQNSVREWESDAVLWLDYVDQSSSLLNRVN